MIRNETEEAELNYRLINYLSPVLFGIGLFGFTLPWMVVASEPVTGFDIATGKYSIAPTEVYAMLAAAAALCGGIIPLFILRRRAWARVWASVAGLICMALFYFHQSEEVAFVEPALGAGFLLTAGVFGLALLLNWALIGGLFRPARPDRSRKPAWRK